MPLQPSPAGRRYGYRPSLADPKIPKFKMQIPLALPPQVSLASNLGPVKDQGSLGACHDHETEVLTSFGWVPFPCLLGNEFLATVNHNTGELDYEQPSRIIARDYEGEMVCGNHRFLDFCVTPDHEMVVSKWNESARSLSDNFERASAEDLGWYFGLPSRVSWQGRSQHEHFILPGVDSATRSEQRLDKSVPLRAWLRFLGLYLAEGTVLREEYKIQIAASKLREKQFARDVFRELEIHACELPDRFTFENKRLYMALAALGLAHIKAPAKFVPRFVFAQSGAAIKELLLGHFMGDGCEQHGIKSHYTSSRRLADDLQLLIFLSGARSHISVREPRDGGVINGRQVKGLHPSYRVSVQERQPSSVDRKEQMARIPYTGKVYCAEVPNFHTLVTRRHGKILISGNCTAFAATGYMEYLYRTFKNAQPVFSPLFLYYKEREKDGDLGQGDTGSFGSTAFWVLNETGVCLESTDPYDPAQFETAPTDAQLAEAAKYKVGAMHTVSTVDDIRSVLASMYPVLIGISVYDSFESGDWTSSFVMPAPTGPQLGGHEIYIYGYDDYAKRFAIRNSWGASWGNSGNFLADYTMLESILTEARIMHFGKPWG